ncbi:hypothetical protein [Solicola sp. PLA-1-18]|uniref:hypothetical protein n=1 Tax=Solicola sp. PLA-1-18 TaxID=3380532 RepID=UPI003B8207F1
MRWTPSRSVPGDVLAALHTEPGERALASARDADGGWLVGTDRALHRTDGDGWAVHPWESLEGASWNREDGELVVVEIAEFGEVEPRHVHRIEAPGRLLELVRERVTASIVARRAVPVRRGFDLQVVVRRSPTRTGDTTYSFVLDPGLEPDDDDVRAAVRRGVAEVRQDLGL